MVGPDRLSRVGVLLHRVLYHQQPKTVGVPVLSLRVYLLVHADGVVRECEDVMKIGG